jgi:bifunctional UDP-N-acetylglucosamine pyrophosphorylase / glucosamine-1-phosphate N-acetyltransferase
MRRVGTVVLAAGKGTRMRSRYPKVAHQVGGRAMLEHVLRAAGEAVPLSSLTSNTAPDGAASSSGHEPSGDAEDHSPRFVVVVGHEREQVQDALKWSPAHGEIAFVVQERQLGTADAVRTAATAWNGEPFQPTTILVLYGDTPLLQAGTLQMLLSVHQRTGSTLTFLTGVARDPTGYGRVLRSPEGQVEDIVEERHATESQAEIPEVNSGVYCIEADWLWPWLDRLTVHENGEYYLTDLVGAAVRDGRRVSTVSAPLEETMGVNDRVQLARAERLMRRRVLRELMLSGVTIEDPSTTYVDTGVQVGQDSVLRPGTTLRGATTIGERCEIGPSSVIRDCTIGDDCMVLASWLESAVMENGSRVGPMSRLRPGAHLLTGAHVGNFGEVKNAVIGTDVQMHHFSYVGDADVGASSNIGAGAITMNYDGKEKHHTEIGERVFIGCDTLLRAPVTIGSDAATGAGSVVTRDVPPGMLAIGMPARNRPRRRIESGAEASSPPEDDATQKNGVPGREERE